METPAADTSKTSIETTSSGRRRIRPIKYNDFAGVKNVSETSPNLKHSTESLENMIESGTEIKSGRKKRGDKQSVDISSKNMSESKKIRLQANENETDVRTSKRKLNVTGESIDEIKDRSPKRQRLSRNTRGKLVAPDINDSNAERKRRKAMPGTSDFVIKTEKIDEKDAKEIKSEGKRRGRETKLSDKIEELGEPIAPQSSNRRGRRSLNTAISESNETDTQSEVNKKVSLRSQRLANRSETPIPHSRRSSRVQDTNQDSPLSGDESTKIVKLKRTKKLRPPNEIDDESVATVAPSDDENSALSGTEIVECKKEGHFLADIFTKKSGKRKRISPVMINKRSSSRASSRIGTTSNASPMHCSGQSSDDQQPTKKQITLPEMLQMKQNQKESIPASSPITVASASDKISNEKETIIDETQLTNETTKCVTPNKEIEKPIATTPKLRSKRNCGQTSAEEYSAEADDEMEEEIRLCNKKKLIVSLRDINADKKFSENVSIKASILISSQQSTTQIENIDKVNDTIEEKIESIPDVNKDSIQSENINISLVAPSINKISESGNDLFANERQLEAVAKKTKKSKISEQLIVIDTVDSKPKEDANPSSIQSDKFDKLLESSSSSTKTDLEELPKEIEGTNKNENSPEKPESEVALQEVEKSEKTEPLKEEIAQSNSKLELDSIVDEKISVITESKKSDEEENTVENKSMERKSESPEKWLTPNTCSNDNVTSVLKINENYKTSKSDLSEQDVKTSNIENRPKVIVDRSNESPEKSNQSTDTTSNKEKAYKISDSESDTELHGKKNTLKSPSPVKKDEKIDVKVNQSLDKKTVIKSVFETETSAAPSKNDSPPKPKTDFFQRTTTNETTKNIVKSDKTECARHSRQDESKPTTSLNTQSNDLSKMHSIPTEPIQPKQEPLLNKPIKAEAQQISPNQMRQKDQTKRSSKERNDSNKSNSSLNQSTASSLSSSSNSTRTPVDSKKLNNQSTHSEIKRETKIEIKQSTQTNYSTTGTSECPTPKTKNDSPNKRESSRQNSSQLMNTVQTNSHLHSSKNLNNDASVLNTGATNFNNSAGNKSSSSNNINAYQVNTAQCTGMPNVGGRSDKHHSKNAHDKMSSVSSGISSVDINKMSSQFPMNQLPNYHHATTTYWQWEPYPYHNYNLSHLDPSATQKSPTKYHKDLANTMYGHGLTSNYLAANTHQQQMQQQAYQEQGQTYQQQQMSGQNMQSLSHQQSPNVDQQLHQQTLLNNQLHNREKSSQQRKNSALDPKHHKAIKEETISMDKSKDVIYSNQTVS